MKFTKMQGAGNDFVVIQTDDTRRNWSRLAIDICDRHFGVGADGLLLLLPSKVANFKMRLFNQDGSESKACGNGMRCLVKLYLDGHPNGRSDFEVTIETLAGIRRAKVHHRRGNVTEIQAAMGKPRVGHNGTPARLYPGKGKQLDITNLMNRVVRLDSKDLLLHLVSIGNPHAVYFNGKSVKAFPLANIGPRVEQEALFPDETNFEVVRVINRGEMEARVWEKGVGETLACGTGACAITVAACLLGLTDRRVKVHLPGGVLTVEWDGKGEVFLSGPAVTVFSGDWND